MQIPWELLDTVIEQAADDPATLCNLCLVSSFVLQKAQQVLYYEIRITDGDPNAYSVWFINVEQSVRLFKTIAYGPNQTLAKHIQKLYIYKNSDDPYFFAFLHKGLQAMTNLRNLVGGISPIYLPKNSVFLIKSLIQKDSWYDHC